MAFDRYYDMDGNAVGFDEWCRLFSDPQYKRVAETTLPGGCWISTVLLGIDHNFGGSVRPIIFETMVFESPSNLSEMDMRRYATKAEAQAGHDEMVTKWTGWTPGEPHPSEGK